MYPNPCPGGTSLLAPPYRSLVPVDDRLSIARHVPRPLARGMALVWNAGIDVDPDLADFIRERPPGVAFIAILPPADQVGRFSPVLEAIDRCRPHSILPHSGDLGAEDLARVLRRPPGDLGHDLMSYLSWRGVEIDRDTKNLIRRTIELSSELRSVAALSRAVYLSRRALGRRFRRAGLPVPSHWLHFGRLLRIAVRLQNSRESLFRVGCEFGYSDGFSLSNQMRRIVGVRPSVARECLGWEWIVESWLRREAASGRFPLSIRELARMETRDRLEVPLASRPARRSLRVAETSAERVEA